MYFALALLIFLTPWSMAQTNDFNNSDSPFEPIPVEKIRHQFEIVGRVLVFDSSGKRLIGRTNEERRWRFGGEKSIRSNWSSKRKGFPDVALQHEWNVSPEGHLTAVIKQYSSMDEGGSTVKLGKLVKEQSFVVENFSAIDWVIEQSEQRRVLVKFSPNPWNELSTEDIGPIAINSRDMMIFDTKGNVWAPRLDNADGTNTYFGVTTHRGSVFLSYVPFPGAKKFGTAEKNRIKIDDGKNKLTIQSNEFFLPQGVSGNVYGWIDLSKRTDSLYSVRAYGSDKESSFLRHIKQ